MSQQRPNSTNDVLILVLVLVLSASQFPLVSSAHLIPERKHASRTILQQQPTNVTACNITDIQSQREQVRDVTREYPHEQMVASTPTNYHPGYSSIVKC